MDAGDDRGARSAGDRARQRENGAGQTGRRAPDSPRSRSRTARSASFRRATPERGVASRAGARSLAPRGTLAGTRRRAGGARAAAALLVIALATGGSAFAWWFATRPASALVTASPTDATITVQGHGTRTGRFALTDLEPTTLAVTVARSGFETATVSVEAQRGKRTVRTVTLVARSFAVRLTSRPAGAAVTLTREDGSSQKGTTPCSLTTSAGLVTVALTRSGYNTFSQRLYLDSKRSVDVLLDPKGQLVHALGSLTAKGAPKSVAVTPNGREAWAAILNGPPSIEIYDLATMRKVGGVDLGKHGAVEVIFNRAGTLAYASQMETAKVFEIDTATRRVTRSFKTKSSWTKVVALSPDERTLYAANWSGNDVSVISLETGTLVKRVPVAKTPRGLWPTADGRYLFVAGFDAGDLERVDLRTWKVKKVFHSGGAMRHLVADEQKGVLYASDMARDVVWACDMKTLAVTRFCTTDEKPNTIELSPDGRILFVSNRGENNPKSYYIPGYEWGTILLFSTVDAAPLDAIVGGNQCTALDVSSDGHTLVFSDFLDDRLRVYDVPDYDTLAAGKGGRYAAHFADLKKARP